MFNLSMSKNIKLTATACVSFALTRVESGVVDVDGLKISLRRLELMATANTQVGGWGGYGESTGNTAPADYGTASLSEPSYTESSDAKSKKRNAFSQYFHDNKWFLIGLTIVLIALAIALPMTLPSCPGSHTATNYRQLTASGMADGSERYTSVGSVLGGFQDAGIEMDTNSRAILIFKNGDGLIDMTTSVWGAPVVYADGGVETVTDATSGESLLQLKSGVDPLGWSDVNHDKTVFTEKGFGHALVQVLTGGTPTR